MIGLGTMVNAGAILVGGIAGIAMAKQLPPTAQSRIKILLAVFTMYTGFKMMWDGLNGSFLHVCKQFFIVMLSVVIGNAIGKLIGIQKGLSWFGQYAKDRFAKAQSSGTAGTPPPAEGFITCTLLFCVGPMAILGAIEDGIGANPNILLIKSAMDGFATMAFVATFGWGVLLSIIPVVAYQGTITLCAGALKPHLTAAMIESIRATGGMIVFCIPIIILELRKVQLADYLPALVIAPLITMWWK
jgi:uncharacterized membrane protein YqgA involved in biofilm formation